ncbi:Nn.00g008510.m01.CDS01 [Neocucurbitaria sp. VM-36]
MRGPSSDPPVEYSRVEDRDHVRTPELYDGPRNPRKTPGNTLTVTERGEEGSGDETSPRTRQISQYLWWLETVCAVLIVGALVGIITTVNAFDNKPLPHWPYRLSINSFIAAYSVLLKTSAGLILAEGIGHIKWTNLKRPRSLHSFWVHDEASRGPWGAVHLLWNDKGRHISSVGALITILILFLEPFSQQIVTFEDCIQVDSREIAAIPRTNYYKEEGIMLGGSSGSIPWDVRNSVNQGLFATNKPQLDFACQSGNCTFPGTYTSLAFCSKCDDVTGKLVRVPWPNPKNITPVPEFARYPRITLLNAETPGQNLTLDIVTNVGSVEENRRSLVARGSPSIEVIRALDTETYVAYSCKIAPCVKSFAAGIRTGLLNETRVSEHMLPRNLMFMAYRVADLDCVQDDKKQQLQEMGYDLSTNPRWLPYNVSVVYNETQKRTTFRGSCQFMPKDKVNKFCDKNKPGAGDEGILLTDEAAQIVPAECVYSMTDTAGNTLNENLFRNLFDGDIQEWWTYSPPALIGNETLMAIWHAGSGNGTLEDISGLMKNISDSLTTHIRQHGHVNLSQPVLGEVHYNTVCIRVQWEWVIYSGAVVALTLVFFIWVIVQARTDQSHLRKAWEKEGVHAPFHDFKSSALTLLFHGLDDDSRRELIDVGSSNRTCEMEKRSKDVNIQLVATERGWKLATVGHHG